MDPLLQSEEISSAAATDLLPPQLEQELIITNDFSNFKTKEEEEEGELNLLLSNTLDENNNNNNNNNDGDHEDIHLAIEDLFGEFFEVTEQPPVDPALVDTRSMLLRLFGASIREEDVDFEDEKQVKLAKEMANTKAAARFAAVEKLFGEAGAAALENQQIEPFGCLQSSLPEIPDIGKYEKLWLTDMPKIAPNRQTLHMDPNPFQPSKCLPLKSTDRMLYTTQNVIRWAHHQGTNTYMSNSRVVRWSDGSVTLHVGSDMFILKPSKEHSLTMLASPSVVRKGKVGIPAMISAVNPDEHFVVEGATAASIEEAVIAENAQFRSVSTQHNLAFSTPSLPNINWNNIKTARTPIEEYILKEQNRRQKIIEQRKKEGRPLTLTEQMEMENELFQKLQTLSAEELLEQQEEQQREAALRANTRQQQQQLRRNRFERNVNLEGGTDIIMENDDRGMNESESDDDDDESNNNNNNNNNNNEDDYETMLEEMRRKRQREDEAEDAARIKRLHQREDAQIAQYQPLMKALQELLLLLPAGSSAAGSVRGTLEFLSTGAFSPAVVARELPLMMEEVVGECPEVNLASVREEFHKLQN